MRALPVSVCIKLGLIVSFMSAAMAPATPISSVVIGSPSIFDATTIFPILVLISSKLSDKARIAMSSLAAVI